MTMANFIKKTCFKFQLSDNREKGISLYLTMILLSLLMAMILGVTSIIVGGAKITKGLGDSVRAFHAADTGAEQALYRIRGGSPDCANFSGNFGESDYNYSVNITNANNCGETGMNIKSTGSYYGAKRKIEVTY